MRWYEWTLVLVLIVFSALTSYYYSYRKLTEPVYVVDINSLVDSQFDRKDIEKVYRKEVTPQEFLNKRRIYLNKLQKILDNFDRPVFVKQAIVGGNVVDITDQVKKHLEK